MELVADAGERSDGILEYWFECMGKWNSRVLVRVRRGETKIAQGTEESAMPDATFEDFWMAREQAAKAYVCGDGSKLDALVPHHGSASFHSPRRDTVVGAPNVASRYLADAKAFHSHGTTRLELIQKADDGDLGFQIATVRIGDAPQASEMRIRVTEVYRRIDGEWGLIHRHADVPRN